MTASEASAAAGLQPDSSPGMCGIYLHIPFCVAKCPYCAFLSAPASEGERAAYVALLCEEIRLRADASRSCDTIYFGGGTPSLLTPAQIAEILEALYAAFGIAADAEITLEANPGTLTGASLAAYRAAGVNRLSMGAESMDDRRLRRLGRIHTAEDVRRDMRLARRAGFDNVNLDLLFAIPGSTAAEAREDLEALIALEPEHISYYSLQLEEDTPFFRQFAAGTLREVPDALDRAMYHEGIARLREHGYAQYEIFNFAQPGRRSRHNSKYWSMTAYLGFGLGAASFARGRRWSNVREREAYRRTLTAGQLPIAEMHENTEHDNISEAVFTGLRRVEGIRYRDILGSASAFWAYYAEVQEEAAAYARDAYLVMDAEGMRLTERGIDISNRIMVLFV